MWRIVTKALAIENYGEKPNFYFPRPKINNGEVLVEIYAASINPLDTKIRIMDNLSIATTRVRNAVKRFNGLN